MFMKNHRALALSFAAATICSAASARAGVAISSFYASPSTIYEGSGTNINVGITLTSPSTSLSGWGATIDFGDGGTGSVGGGFVSGTSHGYANDGGYTVTLNGSGSGYYYGGIFSGNVYQNSTLSGATGVTVLNVAPTITGATLNGTNGNLTVNEGTTVAMQMTSTDPGADIQTFTIDASAAGVGGTSGTRTSSTINRTYADEGSNSISFNVADDDTFTALTRTVTVLNVAPTITGLNSDLTVGAGELFALSAAATDPGTGDVLSFNWDLDNDGQYDDLTGATGAFSYSTLGIHPVGLQVDDGDGGFNTSSFNVNVVPEPSAVALLAFGGVALCSRRPRRSPRGV